MQLKAELLRKKEEFKRKKLEKASQIIKPKPSDGVRAGRSYSASLLDNGSFLLLYAICTVLIFVFYVVLPV